MFGIFRKLVAPFVIVAAVLPCHLPFLGSTLANNVTGLLVVCVERIGQVSRIFMVAFRVAKLALAHGTHYVYVLGNHIGTYASFDGYREHLTFKEPTTIL